MGIGKTSGSAVITDEDTGDTAEVGTKTGGEKALHVLAQVAGTTLDPISVDFAASDKDPFGSLLVVNPLTLVEHPHSVGTGGRYWDQLLVGSATVTYDNTRQAVVSSTTTAINDKVTRQTYRNIQYFKGKGQIFRGTYNFDEAVAGVRKRIGVFKDDNGLFLELDGTTLNFVSRSNTTGSIVDKKHAQSAWVYDKLDGTGLSGKTLDHTKIQLVSIDYAHLGGGSARLFFYIEGQKILADIINTSNMEDRSWSKSGNLPIRTEIENTTAQASARDLYVSCMSIDSAGGDADTGLVQTISTGTSSVTINSSSETVIGSLRCSEDFSHLSILPLGFDFLTDSGSKTMYWRVIYRPTLVGDTWVDLSPVSQELSALTSFSGGFTISEGYLDLANGASKAITLSKDIAQTDSYLGYGIDGTPESLLIVGMTTAGAGAVFMNGSYRTFL